MTAKGCRVFTVCLAVMLAIVCVPQFAANAAAPAKPVTQPSVAQKHRRRTQARWERFNEFAQRLRIKAKEEEEDLAELIELVRVWRMMKEVGLSEEQALEMLKLGREVKKESGKVAEQRKRAMLGLRRLLDDPDTSDQAIKKELEKLDDLEERQRRIAREHDRRMRAGLTVRQQAKLQLFRTRFEGDIRRVIEFVRRQQAGALHDGPRHGRQPHPPGPPRGPKMRRQPPEPPPTD